MQGIFAKNRGNSNGIMLFKKFAFEIRQVWIQTFVIVLFNTKIKTIFNYQLSNYYIIKRLLYIVSYLKQYNRISNKGEA